MAKIALRNHSVEVPALPDLLSQFTQLCEQNFSERLPDAYQILCGEENRPIRDQIQYAMMVEYMIIQFTAQILEIDTDVNHAHGM